MTCCYCTYMQFVTFPICVQFTNSLSPRTQRDLKMECTKVKIPDRYDNKSPK